LQKIPLKTRENAGNEKALEKQVTRAEWKAEETRTERKDKADV